MNLLELLLLAGLVLGLVAVGRFNYLHVRKTAKRLQEELRRD